MRKGQLHREESKAKTSESMKGYWRTRGAGRRKWMYFDNGGVAELASQLAALLEQAKKEDSEESSESHARSFRSDAI